MDDDYAFGAITREFVMARPWRLYSPFADVASDELWCLPDGRIGGYRNSDEAGWVIEDGVLCLTSDDGEVRTRFDIKPTETIRVLLHGAYRGIPELVLTLERRGCFLNLPERVMQLQVTHDLREASTSAFGLSYKHVHELFHGPSNAPRPHVTQPGTPFDIAQYINREHAAASFAFGMLIGDGWQADVFTGAPTRCVATLTRDNRGEGSNPNLPFFYKFVSENGQSWWAISQHVTSQINILYLPDQGIALVRGTQPDIETTRTLIRELEIAVDQSHSSPPPVQTAPYIAVLDLIEGHGHQLINHLPALQRLLDEGGGDKVMELWIIGSEFFGPTQAIFPEFTGRIRRFGSRWQVAAALRDSRRLGFLLSTYGLPGKFQNRLRSVAAQAAPRAVSAAQARHPLIAFTIRGAGRVCRNLSDVVVQTVSTLLIDYPNLGIVLDGWVLPESRLLALSPQFTAWHSPFYREALNPEFLVATNILNRLPAGVLVRCVIGETMLTSVAALCDVDCYVCHVGTLQHKVSFASKAAGVIHGPSRQLMHPEHGHFCAERGYAPVILSPDAVQDIAVVSDRGERFYDYVITDINAVIDHVRTILQGIAGERMARDDI